MWDIITESHFSLQMLMSVQRVQTTVIMTVQILMAPTSVPAMMGYFCKMMDTPVNVEVY